MKNRDEILQSLARKYELLPITFLLLMVTESCWAMGKKPDGAHSGKTVLAQEVEMVKIFQVQMKKDSLFISGKGHAVADGGRNRFTSTNPLSAFPPMEVTVEITSGTLLDACRQRAETARDQGQSIRLEGSGFFRILSPIDPPLQTGIFRLLALTRCGDARPTALPTSAGTPASAGPGGSKTVPAADLVAVPERFLERTAIVSGDLSAPVQFLDPISRFAIQSNGQRLWCYFSMHALPAEYRLALAHGAPGSAVVLQGILKAMKAGPLAGAGPQLEVSNVLSVQ